MRSIEDINNEILGLDKDNPHAYIKLAKLYRKLASNYIELDKISDAYDAVKHYILNAFANDESHEGLHLFSFRQFTNYSLNDISKGKISLSNPSMFNDPLDIILHRWLKLKLASVTDENEKEFYFLLQRCSQFLKVRCFVNGMDKDRSLIKITDLHPLMWAHYADSHRGFCAEYKIGSKFVHIDKEKCNFTRLGKVQYEDELPEIDKLKYNEAIFSKKKIWSYENEIRLVDLDFSCSSDYKTIDAPELYAIYLGIRCTSEDEKKMMGALRSSRNQNAKLYRMFLDDEELSEIKAERIW